MAKCAQCGRFGLLLQVNSQGICVECERKNAQTAIEDLRSKLSPEHKEIERLQHQIASLQNAQRVVEQNIAILDAAVAERQSKVADLDSQIADKRRSLIETEESIQLQEFGLYEPRYDFVNSAEYKARLDEIRRRQKELIKSGGAVTGNLNWMVNNDPKQGKKMVMDMQKLLLRAFNSECDELIDKVKFNTFDSAVRRMDASYDAITKLGTIMSISISSPYYGLKHEELCLAYEYRLKKQQEKEEQKEIRAQMREEAKLAREIEEARKKIYKEQSHYQSALRTIEKQIASASADQLDDLNSRKAEIEYQLQEIDHNIADIDYREANARAGFVYVISNIGSFGENIYKIGMTRRLDPMERVDELGDASVPFNFDVHAMIFSDNAPALEAALHRAFDSRKVNMVNTRREFFHVTLEEIEAEVRKNFDKTVEFIYTAEAEQYRTSVKIRQEAEKNTAEGK